MKAQFKSALTKINNRLYNYQQLNQLEIKGSYNESHYLKNQLSKKLWVGKISKKLPGKLAFPDLNQRALLAYRLSKLVKTPLPKTKIVKNQTGEILLTDFKGVDMHRFLKLYSIDNIKNKDELLENFIFNLWVGNYDKKDSDYL